MTSASPFRSQTPVEQLLVLPCHLEPADILRLEQFRVGMANLMISIATKDNDHGAGEDRTRAIHLTDEGARKLFNALGIYLHRKGPGTSR